MHALNRQFMLLVAVLGFSGVEAQSIIPENGPLFLQNEVAVVNIYLHPDSFDLMLTDIEYGHTHEFDATFIYSTSSISDTLENIGFRLRGNTSLFSAKKSFKVSFNTFSPGASYMGVEKMNLNGEHNDVSIMRSKLGWEIIRNYDLPGSRTSYVKLFVNDEYRGLYLNVEHYDETFVERYYGEKIGNLYKCLWPATLEYISQNPDDYKLESGGRRIYELKTNIEEDDYTGLANFINTLNIADDETFECELEEIFNVDDYLKNAAVEVLLSHWDAYIVNKNNFYLYENPITGKMEYISYDLDNTMGIDWFNVDWPTTDFYNWSFESRPLYDRLMESEKYRNQFSHYIFELITSQFNPSSMISRANEIQDLIEEAALEDDFKGYDYGFTDSDFLNAIDDAWGSHVTYGISDYVNARYQYTLANLEPHTDPIIIKHVSDSLLTIQSQAIKVFAEGELDSIIIDIYENGVLVNALPMIDNGFYLDNDPNDNIYGQIYTSSQEKFAYQIKGFIDGESGAKFCEPKTAWTSLSPNPLRLNEIMANNTSTISDEHGDFDDWIELYNSGLSSASTANLFLTDDFSCPDKWALPDFEINPSGFVLIWADNETNEGALHTNFRLSSAGERIGLFSHEEGAYRLVDLVEFPSLQANETFGRDTDGTGYWDILDIPTPGYSNVITSQAEIPKKMNHIAVYPNPTTDYVNVKCDGLCLVYIYNVLGEKMLHYKFKNSLSVDLTSFVRGVYLMSISSDSEKSEVKIIKN